MMNPWTDQWDWYKRTDPLKFAADPIVRPVLADQPYSYRTETTLHDRFIRVFQQAGISFLHEAPLGHSCRIDFLVGRRWPVGVEIKVNGSNNAVRQQLLNYASAPARPLSIVLFTTVHQHLRLQQQSIGVAFLVVHLAGVHQLPRTVRPPF